MNQPFQDHFSAVAARYADYRPRYPAAIFDHLATLVPRDATAWDCACGNGQASHDLAARFGSVVATDASQEQIAAAESRTNVEFRVAPAECSGLEDAAIDLITVAQAYHWFDRDRFHDEAQRVLKPGGVLAVWAYGIQVVEGDEVNRRGQHFYANVVGPVWPPERSLVESGYRTVAFPFTELTTPVFQMEARWTLIQLLGYFGTWSATNQFIKAKGFDPVKPLRDELAELWGDVDSPRRVNWPLAMRIGRV